MNNLGIWAGVAAVLVAAAGLAYTILRASIADAKEQGDMKGRIDAVEADVIDHEHRIRSLERGNNDRDR